MNSLLNYPTREAQAKAEIGVTAISRRAAIGVMIAFLITIVAVPLIDQFKGGWRIWPVLASPQPLRQRLHAFETTLDDQSTVSRAIRPAVRSVLLRVGNTGVEKVYTGRDGWLFYEPDIQYVTSREFLQHTTDPSEAARSRRDESPRHHDSIASIVDFKKQLAARNIELIIVPIPVKPMVQPEKLWPGAIAPMQNASFALFKEELEMRGIPVFDLTATLAQAARKGSPQYLAQDTHWRPEAMEQAAEALAEFVKKHVELPQSLGMEFGRSESKIRAQGDLANMLESQAAPLELVTIHPIHQPDGQLWTPHTDAAILWLGDSFSNIYSAEPMGWGAAAGFAEQFSFFLSRPIDAIRRNDDGAFATRQMLADELARGHDRLARKKVVIWEFAARELAFGDWKPIEMKLVEHPARHFLVPPAGQTWTIQGTITGKGAAPRPGNVAYRDHILAVQLAHVAVKDHPIPIGQAIVYLRSMTDGKLTPVAALQIGQRVKLKVRDWSEVSRRYEFMNRSDLPQVELRSEPACWGELLP
jgi:alginate O-acetyltransferase complex protein AlgJ